MSHRIAFRAPGIAPRRPLALIYIATAALATMLAVVSQPAAASALLCDALDKAPKPVANEPVTLHILNDSKAQIQIERLLPTGQRVTKFQLSPGKELTTQTHATHSWVASSSPAGECICGHVARWTERGDEWIVDREPGNPELTYSKPTVEGGWKINVSPQLALDSTYSERLGELLSMLKTMASKLPKAAVNALRKSTTIWFERSDCRFPSGVYHPSSKWLKENGMNEDKAKGVQFSADHLDESKDQQAMVLHEFAHAFHDRFLGYTNAPAIDAYKTACADERYDKVPTVYGTEKKAYALTNQTEFFAELSESYFWENDYYPFRREQMEAFDLPSTKVIASLWATKPGAPLDGITGPQIKCPKPSRASVEPNDP